MACIDGSALFLKVEKYFPILHCVDFQSSLLAEFWGCFLVVLVGVTYEDLVPIWLVTLPPNLS
jgi:hypothetical protein